MNLIINFEDDETDILSPGTGATLASYGIGSSLFITLNCHNVKRIFGAENETELSFFNREEYEAFKIDPEVSLLSLRF